MDKKKLKLSISGDTKKTISNIEQAKSNPKNSIIINNRSHPKKKFNRPFQSDSFKKKPFSEDFKKKPQNFNPKTDISDFEKRKLAEQRATKRLKGEITKETKEKNLNKKRELKLTVSRALSDEDGVELRGRSLASIRRARQKENRDHVKDEKLEYKPVKRDVYIPETITIRELANRMSEQSSNLIKHLLTMGVKATINHAIDTDIADYLVKEFGHNPIKEKKADDIVRKIKENKNQNLKSRPPIVTVMGHVDHGKTSLLDVLRKANVVEGEYGGITQHIGAYEVETPKGKITFIDTPGHAAFSSMRARGANTTDIVILVVAANDGIKPQTEEAINHAKAAGVSIVVAINKIDLDGSDIDKVKGDLAAKDLTPEDWGGTTQMVPVSALKGTGVDKLLECVSLEAELLELKAHHKGPAQGAVIETELDKFRGTVATFLIQNGTLKVGDLVASGNSIGKIKSILNSDGSKIKLAGPSAAVEVLGLNNVPNAGDPFQVVENEKQAREIAEYRITQEKERKLLKQKDDTAGDLFESLGQESKKVLNIIVKTDVGGTCEAISAALNDLGNDLGEDLGEDLGDDLGDDLGNDLGD